MKNLLIAVVLMFIVTSVQAAEERTSTLSWVPPTEYTDGSVLDSADIGMYRVYFTNDGTNPNLSSSVIEVPAPALGYVHTLMLEPSPTIYIYKYVVTTRLKDGRESEPSTVGSKQFLVKSSAKPNAPVLTGETVNGASNGGDPINQ